MPWTVSSSSSRVGAVAGGLALPLGDRRAEHEVAEHALLGVLVDRARAAARPSGRRARRSGPSFVHPLVR